MRPKKINIMYSCGLSRKTMLQIKLVIGKILFRSLLSVRAKIKAVKPSCGSSVYAEISGSRCILNT